MYPEPDRAPRTRARHALDEDALFTPIFHEMTQDDIPVVRDGGPPPVEDVDRFRRDPLTAPIPLPVLADAWLAPLSDLVTELAQRRRGRQQRAGSPAHGYRWDGNEWRDTRYAGRHHRSRYDESEQLAVG